MRLPLLVSASTLVPTFPNALVMILEQSAAKALIGPSCAHGHTPWALVTLAQHQGQCVSVVTMVSVYGQAQTGAPAMLEEIYMGNRRLWWGTFLACGRIFRWHPMARVRVL